MRYIKLIMLFLFIITGCTYQNKSNEMKKDGENAGVSVSHKTDSGVVSVVHKITSPRVITVGGNNAEIQGYTSVAIQTAVDALKESGNGGTVKLMPGHFDILAPVMLYDNITLTGSGSKTILKKCKGFRSQFTIDADYGELKVTVADASGFKPGMGVAIYDDKQRYGWDLTTAKITAIEGNTLFIDEYLLRDYHSGDNGTISNACSVISAVEADYVTISNLTVDGSRATNDMIDGCRAGAVYLHKVHKALIENLIVKDFNSDGISWQLTEYVIVRNNEVFGCSNSGLHPGTGSPYTTIEGNNCHDNDGYGLFICWRVRNGEVKNNTFSHNGRNGICTGHKDTDVLFTGNTVRENGSDGIHLRGETPANAPHRSIFKNNTIENNGTKEGGYGISINCKAEGVVIEDNIIRNTGNGKQLAALYRYKNSMPAEMKNNRISGHKDGELVLE
jgi:parallel beta-helix repeat protein